MSIVVPETLTFCNVYGRLRDSWQLQLFLLKADYTHCRGRLTLAAQIAATFDTPKHVVVPASEYTWSFL
jgi:hypothetical protein